MAESGQHTRRCGYVAIVGRPNVGKSTLLNHLLGQKISITSRKPQTTRHQVVGIKTTTDYQVVFVDTPGLHSREPRAINRYMNRAASNAMADVDAVLMVLDRTSWNDEDQMVLQQVQRCGVPTILVVNKIDLLTDKTMLLPHLEFLSSQGNFAAVVPVSALQNQAVSSLEHELVKLLPMADFFFPEEQITDRSQRFLAAELVREKITRQLGDELPYAVAVEIEEFKTLDKVIHISALILVERSGQKKILIGSGGSRLKSIGSEARRDMEKLFDQKVMLRLWIKIRSGWSDDERALRSLGYNDV